MQLSGDQSPCRLAAHPFSRLEEASIYSPIYQSDSIFSFRHLNAGFVPKASPPGAMIFEVLVGSHRCPLKYVYGFFDRINPAPRNLGCCEGLCLSTAQPNYN